MTCAIALQPSWSPYMGLPLLRWPRNKKIIKINWQIKLTNKVTSVIVPCPCVIHRAAMGRRHWCLMRVNHWWWRDGNEWTLDLYELKRMLEELTCLVSHWTCRCWCSCSLHQKLDDVLHFLVLFFSLNNCPILPLFSRRVPILSGWQEGRWFIYILCAYIGDPYICTEK